MPKADVGRNVTLYGQEVGKRYCGEANAQMARNGYPDPADRLHYTQDFLNPIILAQNSARKGDKGQWNTDPKGLRLCLQSLSSAPVSWVECVSRTRQKTQLFIQQCIGEGSFPTPVLVNEGLHWVLVVGWETKAAHAGGPQTLKHVHYYDPEPAGIGADITVTAREWNRSTGFSAVGLKGTWKNKYVAVGQRS